MQQYRNTDISQVGGLERVLFDRLSVNQPGVHRYLCHGPRSLHARGCRLLSESRRKFSGDCCSQSRGRLCICVGYARLLYRCESDVLGSLAIFASDGRYEPVLQEEAEAGLIER